MIENPEIKDVQNFRKLKDDRPELVEALKRPGRPKSDNPKEAISVRLDPDIVAWLKSEGAGYQTRMNAMLREIMEEGRV